MFSGSEAGSYLRLMDCVYHSTLGLRVIKKKKKKEGVSAEHLQARVMLDSDAKPQKSLNLNPGP